MNSIDGYYHTRKSVIYMMGCCLLVGIIIGLVIAPFVSVQP